jgi:8-oxo-dGTP pyrophosphatase MutT (NUDIX family)
MLTENNLKYTTRIAVLRYNPNKKRLEIYIQKKKNGRFELPGGKVDIPDENTKTQTFVSGLSTNAASALQELQEETGLPSATLTELGFFNYINCYKGKNTYTKVILYQTLVNYQESLQMDYRKALEEDSLGDGGWISFDYFIKILEGKLNNESQIYSTKVGVGEVLGNTLLISKDLIQKLKNIGEEIFLNPEIVGEKEVRARIERIKREQDLGDADETKPLNGREERVGGYLKLGMR